MSTLTHAKLIRIGNSQGLRLSKAMLAEAGIDGPVELETRGGEIVIRPAAHVRDAWADAYDAALAQGTAEDEVDLQDVALGRLEWDELEREEQA